MDFANALIHKLSASASTDSSVMGSQASKDPGDKDDPFPESDEEVFILGREFCTSQGKRICLLLCFVAYV